MKYQEFVVTMKEEVQKKLGNEVEVSIQKRMKNNGVLFVGLAFLENVSNSSPIIYLESFYDKFKENVSLDTLVLEMIQVYKTARKEEFICDENWSDFDYVKDKIVMTIVGTEKNKDLLNEIPYLDFLDLAICFRVRAEAPNGNTGTLSVTNEHLKIWGVTKEEILQKAIENTETILPLNILSCGDYMFLITNEKLNFGASAILYKDTLNKMNSIIGEPFYLLPSSVHEWIAVPESLGMEKEYLKFMVSNVNSEHVEPEDILSDNVYYYDGKIITIV